MEIPIGADVELRGDVKGAWRLVNTSFDGLVQKYIIQSKFTGETKNVFKHQIVDKSTSTYQELNEFFHQQMEVEEASLHELCQQLFCDFDENSCNRNAFDTVGAPAVKAEERELEQPAKRFKTFEKVSVEELKERNTEQSTKSSTTWAVSILKEWMKESDMNCEGFEQWPEEQLDNLLEMFYSCVRTKKGTDYSKPSLIGIRSGINRYLTEPPFSRRISLMQDRVFMGSNQVIGGKIKPLKRQQLDVSEHKEPVNENDMKTLYQTGVFSTESPKTLQNKVQFEIMLQFGRRGREGLRELKKNSFKVETDSSGVQYVSMTFNESDKTHHGLDSRESIKKPRMYEQVGNKHCPVSSYLKYVSKLNPNCDAFFQRPLSVNVNERHTVWYGNQPVGINTLNSFMPRLSADAGLSMRYTNHCIRATTSSTQQRAGVSNTAIMSVTGHRNVQSLCSYIKPTEKDRQDISKILSSTNLSGAEMCNTDTCAVTAVTNDTPANIIACNETVDVSINPNTAVRTMPTSLGNSYNQNQMATNAGGNISNSTINVYIRQNEM